MGVDVFKTDFGEDIPVDAVFHDGRTGADVHNLYPLLYNRAVAEVTAEERGGGLVWGRSGTAGSQRYPVCWSGDPAADWDSLAATIRGGLSLGLSGVPFWSHDIGGYRGTPAPDLYARWAQFGLLGSHSRMHGDGPREPWIFGPEANEIVLRYVRLRYRLFPYFHSLAYEAARTGRPVLRAMPLAFPRDPNAHGLDHQFMIGPWLLAAPIFNTEGRRTIYFPAGTWYDFWTGKAVTGPRAMDIAVPLAKMPFYIRAGAILPTMKPGLRIPEGPIDPLIMEIWTGPLPPAPAIYRLFEEEGVTDFRLGVSGSHCVLSWNGRRGGGLQELTPGRRTRVRL
jgi:alpha-D-xyloside xylohydrolase